MAETTGGERWARVDYTAEAVPGVQNAVPTWSPFRVAGGGFGVKLAKAVLDVTEQANTVTQPADVLSHHAPGGTMDVIPSPFDTGVHFGGSPTRGFLRFLLDWALTRTSGVLDTHTIHETQNNLLTRQFMGCKINQMTLSFQSTGGAGGFLTVSTDIVGMFGGRAATALLTGAMGTLPSSRHWIVSQVSVELGKQLVAEFSGFTASNNSLSAFSITLNNNITPGAVGYQYPATAVLAQEDRRNGIRELLEGELEVTGSFTIKSEDDSWFDRMMESDSTDLTGFLRVLAFHPDSALAVISGTGFTADHTADTSDCEVAADPTSDFFVGDVPYIEDASAADPETWEREVLHVTGTNAAAPAEITFDTDASTDSESLGRDTVFDATGDSRVYSKGLQLRVPQFKVQDIEFPGDASSKVEQTVTFQAEADSAGDVFGALVR